GGRAAACEGRTDPWMHGPAAARHGSVLRLAAGVDARAKDSEGRGTQWMHCAETFRHGAGFALASAVAWAIGAAIAAATRARVMRWILRIIVAPFLSATALWRLA